MVSRQVRLVAGVVVMAAALYLVFSPMVMADLLNKPPADSSAKINLRASWGGTLLGLGAFVAWLPALRPWPRFFVGMLGWAMAGIFAARAVGFVLDGDPDQRQYVWISAEAVIAVLCAIVVRRLEIKRRA